MNQPQLNDEVPEERIQRVWSRIESTRTTRTSSPRASTFLAAAGVAAAIALAVFAWNDRDAQVGEALAPLRFEDGEMLPNELMGPREVELSDGSAFSLGAQSTLTTIRNDGSTMEVVQHRGRVEYSVERLGRAWRIDAGHAVIEVVGTEFIVERGEAQVIVSVSHGVVLVRSPLLDDGVVRLGAGEQVELEQSPMGDLPIDVGSALTPEASPTAQPGALPSTRPGGLSGAQSGALPSTQSDGLPGGPSNEPPTTSSAESVRPAQALSAAELMNEADQARRTGQRDRALQLLQRAVELGDGDSDLAAMTLARLVRRTSPAHAATLFARAESLGLPEPLRREARRARAQCLESAGQNAATAWREFYRAYPDEPLVAGP